MKSLITEWLRDEQETQGRVDVINEIKRPSCESEEAVYRNWAR